jgi:CRISPR-associated protein Cst1
MSSITLYPSNWLYNAGVVGLFSVRENAGEPVQEELLGDGSAQIPDGYFEPIQINKKEISKAIVNLVNALVSRDELTGWLNESNMNKYQNVYEELGEFGFKFIRAGNKLFASKTPYQNLVQLKEWQSYEYPDLVKEIPNLIDTNKGHTCNLCAHFSVFIQNPQSKLQLRLSKLQSTHLKSLGPSLGEFPNGFWGLNESMGICCLCSFLIIHHHLAFTPLSDGSEIFINAPSFKVMYYLNKFAREVFGALSAEEMRSKRNILAMSMIEYATKVQATLGVWTGMNIEVVSRRGSQIEFFSLPYEVVQLLSDRRIGNLLSQIGEFSILNRVLAQDFSRLMETGYRLLRIGLKAYGERGKSENDFINQTLRLEKNRRNPARVAEQIFQLSALIEEKQNRRKAYEYIYGS